MKKLKLCNVHRLALSNEGEARKPIHIPFGTWPYDDRVSQTLDREHAEKIANELAASVAKGEPGIPVYQGHPDVPEYAGKYPDKGALGWVKRILVNEDGMDLEVEWDRDPGKGFGWFSPYWTGDDPVPDASGRRNVIVDGLTSVGLVNNPNIREFRLANEAGENLTQRRREAEVAAFKLPTHLLALAKRFDDRVALANVVDANGAGHGADGKFDGSGSGGGGKTGKAESFTDRVNKDFEAEQRRESNVWSKLMGKWTPLRMNASIADIAERRTAAISSGKKDEAARLLRLRAVRHKQALLAGFKYNRSTHQYE